MIVPLTTDLTPGSQMRPRSVDLTAEQVESLLPLLEEPATPRLVEPATLRPINQSIAVLLSPTGPERLPGLRGSPRVGHQVRPAPPQAVAGTRRRHRRLQT